MTFAEIQANIVDRLNLTSTNATTRVGKSINECYRLIASSLGIQTIARVNGITSNTVVGTQSLAFGGGSTKVIKILSVYNALYTPPLFLEESTIELLRMVPNVSDPATSWAPYQTTGDTVTIWLNSVPATIYTLTADVYATQATLSGSNVPAFAENFHDILELGGMAIELEKMEKYEFAARQWEKFWGPDRLGGRLSELRMFYAASAYKDIQQGGRSMVSQWSPMVS